jgi:putative serine protease PepD
MDTNENAEAAEAAGTAGVAGAAGVPAVAAPVWAYPGHPQAALPQPPWAGQRAHHEPDEEAWRAAREVGWGVAASDIPIGADMTPNEERKPWRGRRAVLVGALAAAVLAGSGATGGAVALLVDRHSSTSATTVASTTVAGTGTTSSALTRVISSVKAVVVDVTVTGQGGEDEGSGVVVRSDGLILTNYHVVSAATSGGTITITLSSGKTVSATIVASSQSQDLALLKASGLSGLAVATFADSDSVQVGDTVFAIGNELGLSGSVSAGIVSALHRTLTVSGESMSSSSVTYSDAIQTDAAVNQGDSGGALFNASGQVIGINAAIASSGTSQSGTAGSIGVGFAIPINTVKTFIAQASV